MRTVHTAFSCTNEERSKNALWPALQGGHRQSLDGRPDDY